MAAASTGAPAWAQRGPQDPHLAYAFPAGCQQGQTCEIVLGGQHLREASSAHISGEGVTVEVVRWYRPMTRGEFNDLRMALEDARTQLLEARRAQGRRGPPPADEVAREAGITEDQQREMEVFLQRERDPKRQPNEQLSEEVTLRFSVARSAAPGRRELRLLTETSMSNPVWVQIGRWPEVRETEPNDITPDTAIDLLPVVVNGQVSPGDTDTFTFFAPQGTRLVIQAAAREVIPYLADAVPGWFQAVLSLSDSSGRELVYADSFHFRQDPLIYFEVPRDDHYTVSIHDSLYRGREDFVYRITLGELPFVTSIFPLGARTDTDVTVELEGWNLTQERLTVHTLSRRSYRPVRWYEIPQEDGSSVRFPLQIDHLPEVFDAEPNDRPEDSQSVSPRMIINGRIDHPGDQDLYRIEGHGRLVAEVQARRHGSPLDSVLTLTDADGRELAFNDDHEDRSQALLTHHADSQLHAVLPGSGTCYLRLSDAQQNGGKAFVYRLYLRAPEPDYELRVTPSSIVARPGAVVPLSVVALRKDGFAEDIELSLVEPPPGFQLSGGLLPGQSDHVRMTLTVPREPLEGPVVLEMEGHVRGRSSSRRLLSRPAVPAENIMQAFIWYHLVPVEDWNAIVSGRPAVRPPFELVLPSGFLKVPRGGETLLPVRMLQRKELAADELHVELQEPPPGVSAELITSDAGELAIRLAAAAGDAADDAGWRGNLLLRAHRETTPPPTEAEPAPQPRRTDYGYLPAIPIEVTGRRPAR